MFDAFSLPDVTKVGRRTVLGALGVAVVALGVSLLVNYPLVGVGACLGLGLGILNFRLITASVVKVGKRADENKRRPLAMNTLSRLAIISVITIGLLFLNFGLGFGVLGGLAVFQMLLLGNVTRSMWNSARRAAAPGDHGAGGQQEAGAQRSVIDGTARPRGDG